MDPQRCVEIGRARRRLRHSECLAAEQNEFSACTLQPQKANGTVFNSAPEILGSSCPNSTKTDVYAYGMILWELVSRCDPYASTGIPGRLVQLLVVERRRPYLGPRQRRIQVAAMSRIEIQEATMSRVTSILK